MPDGLYLILGLLIGAALGAMATWIFLRRRGEPRGAVLEEKAALEATLAELRGQLAVRERELAEARSAVEAERVASAEARTRLESAREHFAEQRRQIEEMDKKVRETFTALSAEALKNNNAQFLTLADEKMKPLREQLARYEKQIQELEKARAEAYGGLTKHLRGLEEGRELLSRETRQLVSALRHPGTKGQWGEVTLRNVVELTGMSSYCDFTEQAAMAGESGPLRPDMIVRLPGGRSIVVDSKVNASAYLDAMQAADEAQKKQHLARYATGVRSTMRNLAKKEYARGLPRAPEFVVMFMPGEAFFAAAVGEDAALLTDGVGMGVLLASPTTLAALLMAIRYGWQQQQMAENAEKIASAGRELHDRLCTFADHLNKIRGGLEAAARAYDAAVGNWESRTRPSAQKLKELDAAAAGKDIPELGRVNANLRPVINFEPDSESP